MAIPQIIKLCGLSTPEAIDSVVEGRATHAGFIFFKKSPRHVPLDLARRLNQHMAGRIAKVAVTVNADDGQLDEIVEALEPDVLQLHGRESPARANHVASRYGLPIWKALAIGGPDDLKTAKAFDDVVEWLLFDAKPPKNSNLPGGNGVTFDWHLLKRYEGITPWILSGGLNLDNLHDALHGLRPRGIDVSSGVETAPGVKSPGLIRDFLNLCCAGSETQ